MQEAPTPQSKAEPGNGKIALGALLGLTIIPGFCGYLFSPDSPLPIALRPVAAAILFALPTLLVIEGAVESRRATRRKSSYRNNC